MNKISGVYKITNKITGDFYIGSSKDIKTRWAHHKCQSSWKQQPESQLYQAFQDYGLENFKFEIIEETDNIKEQEQYFIETLNPSYNKIKAYGFDKVEYNKNYQKKYYKTEKGKRIIKGNSSKYRNQYCCYNNEVLTLQALRMRFTKLGISHPTIEAKKYLI